PNLSPVTNTPATSLPITAGVHTTSTPATTPILHANPAAAPRARYKIPTSGATIPDPIHASGVLTPPAATLTVSRCNPTTPPPADPAPHPRRLPNRNRLHDEHAARDPVQPLHRPGIGDLHRRVRRAHDPHRDSPALHRGPHLAALQQGPRVREDRVPPEP